MSSNMNAPELSGPEHVQNPEVSFEPRDLSARGVIGFLIALAILGVILQVGLWGYYKYLAAGYLESRPVTNPIGTSKKQLEMVGGDPAVMFPSPRLQPDPVADLNKFRVREEEELNSYGWTDQAAGKVHIPIERAIDIVAETGLPVRPGTQAATPKPDPAAGGVSVKGGAGPGLRNP
jgi:hypothetical protein